MSEFEKRYAKLNPAQQKAVDCIEGPVLVFAGPGSGKTELLALRIANILRLTDTDPSNILCLTFTDAAAINMRQRLIGLIGETAHKVTVHTFHSLGKEIISRHSQYFYAGAQYRAADELRQIETLERLITDLPHQDPLRSYHPEMGFTYLHPVKAAIGHLKNAGLTPEQFQALLDQNQVAYLDTAPALNQLFSQTVSKTLRPQILDWLTSLQPGTSWPFEPYLSWTDQLKAELEPILERAEASDQNQEISAWKQSQTAKQPSGQRIHKDLERQPKMVSLAQLYAQYQAALHTQGFYDFNDMLLDTVQALKEQPTLLFELQEQYQYMAVDEFQDTNGVQLQLIKLLADAPVNEGRPNLMAVGDANQAIYKFQGANARNAQHFIQSYTAPTLITLEQNYRSTASILALSDQVLDSPSLIQAANPELPPGQIDWLEYQTEELEGFGVAKQIKDLIQSGVNPNQVAVIGRTHQDIKQVLPYLSAAQIPVYYEKKQNVLLEPHIQQLIQIVRFVTTVAGERATADYLLPEILSYPFWELDPMDIWKLSIYCHQEQVSWLEGMLQAPQTNLQSVAKLLITWGTAWPSLQLETALDLIMGSTNAQLPDTEDEASEPSSNPTATAALPSPYKPYYFNPERFEHQKAQYLSQLSSLKSFVGAIREYRVGESLNLTHLIEFVDLHQQNDLPISDLSVHISNQQAVSLLTAHKAKGLEFEQLFILGTNQDTWTKGGRGDKLPFPINLTITPEPDLDQDFKRIFYVALTRAKHTIHFSRGAFDAKGKELIPLSYLSSLTPTPVTLSNPDLKQALEVSLQPEVPLVIGPDQKVLLEPLLTKYCLSVTHLNNFLDLKRGGPQAFLEQNLLRYPGPKTNSSSFGTAIHAVLNQIHRTLQASQDRPSVATVLNWFDQFLLAERLLPADHARYLSTGHLELERFYQAHMDSFKPSDFSEYSFDHSGVVLAGTPLSGKIDKLVKHPDGTVSVTDYKTGKAHHSFVTGSDSDKITLRGYERQLIFYKLLVDHAKEFKGQVRMTEGSLLFVQATPPEPDTLSLTLDDTQTERLQRLIQAVYHKIKTLDFPDTSSYPKTLAGIIQFEEDLITGAI